MKSLFVLALLAGATICHAQTAASAPPAAPASAAPSSPAKKALVAKAIQLQLPILDSMAREVVMRPVSQMGQAVGAAIQNLPQEKREGAAKSIDADMRKFVDESVPLMHDRAVKLAPETIGPILEEKMSEDDLKQLVAWLESPAAKKYQQLGGEMQQSFGQRLIAEANPILTPKLQALELKIRTTLGIPPSPGTPPASAPPAKAAAPAKKASGK